MHSVEGARIARQHGAALFLVDAEWNECGSGAWGMQNSTSHLVRELSAEEMYGELLDENPPEVDEEKEDLEAEKFLNQFTEMFHAVPRLPCPLNTKTDLQAAIKEMKRLNLRDMVLVSPPMHQLRAFMTAVAVVTDSFWSMFYILD